MTGFEVSIYSPPASKQSVPPSSGLVSRVIECATKSRNELGLSESDKFQMILSFNSSEIAIPCTKEGARIYEETGALSWDGDSKNLIKSSYDIDGMVLNIGMKKCLI